MAKVIGTRGKVVNFDIGGIKETMIKLGATASKIKDGADLGVVRAGAFVKDEVKESMAQNRAEPKSVDTGLLINSIEFFRTGEGEGLVKPRRKTYPKTNVTTEDTALLVEFSPNIKGGPRHHFRNTEKRTKGDVRKIIDKAIKIAAL